MSASEVSDDGFDINNEDKPLSVTKAKQNARETRSQVAEKRGESTPGPSLRVLRPQRGSRTKSIEGKKSVQARDEAGRDVLKLSGETEEHVKLQPIADTVENPGSDDLRIVVDDFGDGEDEPVREEIPRNVCGSNDHVGDQDIPDQDIPHQDVVSDATSSELITTTSFSSTGKLLIQPLNPLIEPKVYWPNTLITSTCSNVGHS